MSENDFEELQAKYIPEPPGIPIPEWLAYVIPIGFLVCVGVGASVILKFIATGIVRIFQ